MTKDTKPQRPVIAARLAHLARTGQLTERDEEIFEYLSEHGVLSLDHLWRLFWPKASQVVAYQRLNKLAQSWLVRPVQPLAGEMERWGLRPGPVYCLGPGGQLWLRPKEALTWREPLTPVEMVPRLLAAEVFVRLVEAVRQHGLDWRLAWNGAAAMRVYQPKTERLLLAPDAFGTIGHRNQNIWLRRKFFVHCDGFIPTPVVEASWREIVQGYGRYYYKHPWQNHPAIRVTDFPLVTIMVPTEQELASLAAYIQTYRSGPIIYYLAAWPDVIAGSDLFTQLIWQIHFPDGLIVGQTPAERQSLIGMQNDGQPVENPDRSMIKP